MSNKNNRESSKQKDDKAAAVSPLIEHIFTADPSAHVFHGKIYIYASHDIDAGIPFDDLGSHFAMNDYHVFSMDNLQSPVVDHGVALHVRDIPWAEKQLWAPDATEKENMYYLFFPAKDYEGIFRIGVATSESATGPFIPQPKPIANSFSIDPAVFKDIDGSYYLYFGGIWGGQLQRWRTGSFNREGDGPFDHLPASSEPALQPKIAKLRDDLLEFAEEPKNVVILNKQGKELLQGDHEKRFFEGPWMHYYRGLYYLSYSTGDTHCICYATGKSPYGPFIYKGIILHPVIGWTTHHSIVEIHGKWYLFYHDSSLSDGVTHLRCVKMTELFYDDEGNILTIFPDKRLCSELSTKP